MSKPSHRPTREARKEHKQKRRAALAYSPSERGRAFVLQMTSRREANRELSRPAFVATLQELFPELDTLPHADTLHRLLSQLDVTQLEQAHVAVIWRLIRGKKFRRYLITQCYPIAIDGTQKSSSAAVSGGARNG
jgi:hypothetical protein